MAIKKVKPMPKPGSKKKGKTVVHKRFQKTAEFKPLAKRIPGWTLAVVLLISFLCYLPALKGEFVWDDSPYIQNNPLIYSLDLKQIFSQYVMGNYHPVTMLMLTVEYHFFGFNVTGYHLVNVSIHLINVVLVFRLILMLCQKEEIALITALFFGIHPLHVESVAWISELKDLLYTMFFLSSCILYLKYTKELQLKYYLLSLILFFISLLSKAMAASLPLVLILFDYYKGRLTKKTVLIKIPFLLLSICFGIVAIAAQKSIASIQDIASYDSLQRLAFASRGFITYLFKLVFPFHLSAVYPYPIQSGESLPGPYYIYLLVFPLLTAFLIYSFRYSKKFFLGFAFFTITVFLVLQLLPVGNSIMAERYSYIPSIGILYLFAEGLYWLKQKKQKNISYGLIIIFLIFFSITTYKRCGVWKNGMTLWSDVIQKFPNAVIAYNNRGLLFAAAHKNEQALQDYAKAIQILQNYAEAYNNRGAVLMDLKKYPEALSDFNTAISLRPKYSKAYFNKGLLYMLTGQGDSAVKNYDVVIQLNPSYDVYLNKGFILHNQNKFDEALIEYNKARDIQPNNSQVHFNIGLIMMAKEKYNDAIASFSRSIELNLNYAQPYYYRGMVENITGNRSAACNDFSVAQKLGFAAATEAIKNYCSN